MSPQSVAVVALLLVIVGLVVWLWARRQWAGAGLPRGRLVYGDTGRWERTREPLFSRRYGLTGRPDYLVRVGNARVPVEVKSGQAPAQPYEGHVLQLAAYCLLAEEVFGVRPPYGLLRYDNATLEIPYDEPLRSRLLDTLAAMREARAHGSADRDHDTPQKCLRCGQRENCDQRLV
ncbi:MAG: CRISPR-associated protein Cas4 [Anaerolineales bacterium]